MEHSNFFLPYDYLSGKYRQLYRTDPEWIYVDAPVGSYK